MFVFFKKSGVLIGAILLVTFLAFSPVLQNDFVHWDDPSHLLNVPEIRDINGSHLKKIFQKSIQGVYVPLTLLSFAVEYHFFQFNPFIYHLTNLCLHLGIVFLIFFLGRRLGLSKFASFAATMIFALHPMHVESVAWVTERKDVLYAFFYALALFHYLGYLQERKKELGRPLRFLAWVFVCGLLSVLAKPMALSLPLILFLFDWMKQRKIDFPCICEKVPLAVMIGGIALITYLLHQRMPMTNIMEGILIWPWTFVFHIGHFLFPSVYVPIYRLPYPVTIVNPVYLLPLMVFLFIIVSLFIFRKKKWYVFAIMFYFFSVFFLLRFDVSMDTNVVADRWMYLPSLGFCFFFGYLADWGMNRNRSRQTIRLLAFCFLTIFLGVLFWKTYNQCKVWKNTGTLWMHQIHYSPSEPIALSNMATYLRQLPDFPQAVEHYKKVYDSKLKIHRDEEDLQFERVQVVLDLYSRAAKVNFDSPDMHYNLAEVYCQVGRYEEALQSYREAAKIFKGYNDVLYKIARIYFLLEDYNQSGDYLRQYLDWNQDPQHARYAHYLQNAKNLIKCLSQGMPQNKDALKVCENNALKINSNRE